MGIFDKLTKVVGGMSMGAWSSASLREAAQDSSLNSPGVYKLYYKGCLMKVGKAEDGLRKRFSDYYRGKQGGTAYLKYIDESNRDGVKVQYKKCDRSECRALELQLYDEERDRGESLPWSDRR